MTAEFLHNLVRTQGMRQISLCFRRDTKDTKGLVTTGSLHCQQGWTGLSSPYTGVCLRMGWTVVSPLPVKGIWGTNSDTSTHSARGHVDPTRKTSCSCLLLPSIPGAPTAPWWCWWHKKPADVRKETLDPSVHSKGWNLHVDISW